MFGFLPFGLGLGLGFGLGALTTGPRYAYPPLYAPVYPYPAYSPYSVGYGYPRYY